MRLDSLNDVFKEQVEDLFSAEQQLIAALPKVAKAASTQALREAIEEHLEETRGHAERLEQLFGQLGIERPTETCEAMQGLIAEGEKIVEATGDPTAIDAALIAAAQRIEHYEIAAYGTARALAAELDLDDAEMLLAATLDEESKANDLLNKIATGGMMRSGVNRAAAS